MTRVLAAVRNRLCCKGSGCGADDGGSAIIEFVFVAIVVMVPLIYLIAAVATMQRTELGVTQAARNAGRAFATSDTQAEAGQRSRAAVRLALHDQGLPDDADLHYVAAGRKCGDRRARITPQLRAGSEFAVCVTRRVDLPGVPRVLAGHGVRTIGEYVVHVDDFRVVGR